MPPTVLWFRRDLRLADHPALLAAIDASDGGGVLPLFVLDDRLRDSSGANRLAFLYRSLRSLDESMGGRLIVRTGDPVDVVPALVREIGATSVHVSADFGPYGHQRDMAVEAALGGVATFVRTGSPYGVDPGEVRKQSGTPFKVFTPFLRAWKEHPREAPSPIPKAVHWVDARSDGVPADPEIAADLPEAGERAAHARFATFVERIGEYDAGRNAPALDATSRLSVYLKYGAIHPRQLVGGLGRTKGEERFLFEVVWREFYADVLWHNPTSVREALQPAMRDMAVDEGPETDERFSAWAEGRTGFPIVDAGMRQLATEGWMHNRVRMIAASFLVKDLHLDWGRGARLFMDRLVDGDLASNDHGWQWVAGTGTDAAPYFRVFNPMLQGEKFDPGGVYVRRYIPELEWISDKYLHHPWDDPAGPPADYPLPIVDHFVERDEALARYRAITSGGEPSSA